MSDPAAVPAPPEHQALADALAAVLDPLARLAVGRGLPYAAVEELLKRAFVQAAIEAQADPTPQRKVSRLSTATGLSRREITRLLEGEERSAARPRSLSAEIFAHWTTSPEYRDRRGVPRVLPRQGPGRSFESLAQTITRDVHPRSLLDELLRLGLATHDAERDTVTLQRDAFVPRGDAMRMLGFLGDNVGDHLSAAVRNVLGDGSGHFEQAIFADGLSPASVDAARALVRAQWQGMIDALVPRLEDMVERDHGRGDQRLRIGLYTFHDQPAAPAAAPAPASAGAPATRRRAPKERP